MLPYDTDLTWDAQNTPGNAQSVSTVRATWGKDLTWGLGHLGQVLALPYHVALALE